MCSAKHIANDDDYTVGDLWRDVRKAQQEKRASNREQSPTVLTTHGIGFESKNGGAHLVVTHNSAVADFWPGTGKWIVRGGPRGRGVFNLIKRLAK